MNAGFDYGFIGLYLERVLALSSQKQLQPHRLRMQRWKFYAIFFIFCFFFNYFFPYPRTHETRHCALSRSYNLDLLWNNYQASADDDDDDDMDLFGEETEEEKKAAEERAAAIKASAKKKESEF